jgi:peptide deformylase
MEILTYPNPILRRKAGPIKEIDSEIIRIAQEMLDAMYDVFGIGLAAPQVGFSKRLVVMDIADDKTGERVFINPYIIEEKGEIIEEEGCLSFPGMMGQIIRSQCITVIAYNLKGQKLKIEAEDLLSRAWQHEIDHIDGRLFIERMTPESAVANKQKIKEFELDYQNGRAGVS